MCDLVTARVCEQHVGTRDISLVCSPLGTDRDRAEVARNQHRVIPSNAIDGLEAYFAFFEHERRVLEYAPHDRCGPIEYRETVIVHSVSEDYERSGPISPHSTRPPEPPLTGSSV